MYTVYCRQEPHHFNNFVEGWEGYYWTSSKIKGYYWAVSLSNRNADYRSFHGWDGRNTQKFLVWPVRGSE